ncbi:MAG: hypothetical protein ACXABY_36520 [Candidatus Thorarchaeota archaeon]|jgi:hypothetical protein
MKVTRGSKWFHLKSCDDKITSNVEACVRRQLMDSVRDVLLTTTRLDLRRANFPVTIKLKIERQKWDIVVWAEVEDRDGEGVEMPLLEEDWPECKIGMYDLIDEIKG